MKNKPTVLILMLLALFFGQSACELENPEEGIAIEEIISLSIEGGATSLLADSTSQVEIIATLGAQAAANSSITFRTEDGRFAEAAVDTPQTYTVNASSKTARATLISSTTVSSSVVLSAQVGDFTNTTSIEFARAAATDFTVELNPPIVTAGANASTIVTVQLYRNDRESIPSNNTKVSFDLTPLDSARAEVPAFLFSSNSTAQATVRSTNGEAGLLELEVTVEGLSSFVDTIQYQ
ncbi:MAG: hypothetical protein AAFP19_26300 [Bacteroidota bacterium]